jgi:hypothetical protein
MKLVYQHWQHGRLIEGEIPGIEQPLPILTIFLNLGVPERTVLEGLLHGQLSIDEVMRAAPVMRYILIWHDGDTAYYAVAKRWRD